MRAMGRPSANPLTRLALLFCSTNASKVRLDHHGD